MTTTAGALTAAAVLLLAACSSSSRHATSTSTASTGGNPCAALAGTPVGRELDATDPNGGRLAAPPKACADAADISNLGGCYPANKPDRDGDWFFYTRSSVTAFGRPGSTWHVKSGDFDRSIDLAVIDC